MTNNLALHHFTNIHNIFSEHVSCQQVRRSPRKLPSVNYGLISGKTKSPSKCAKATTSKVTSPKKNIIPGTLNIWTGGNMQLFMSLQSHSSLGLFRFLFNNIHLTVTVSLDGMRKPTRPIVKETSKESPKEVGTLAKSKWNCLLICFSSLENVLKIFMWMWPVGSYLCKDWLFADRSWILISLLVFWWNK